MGSFISKFFKGVASVFWAVPFVFGNGLWPYLIYPIVVYVFLFFAGIATLFGLYPIINEWLNHWLGADSMGSGWLFVAKGYLAVVLGIIVKILSWFIFGWLNKYIVMILMSPLYAFLSEKVEEKLTGKSFPFSLPQLMIDILRGIAITLRNMFLELGIILACGLLAFIPVLNLFVPFILFFVSAYFMGFSLFDYNCERHRMTYKNSIQFMRFNRPYLLGVGSVYNLLSYLPIIGFIVPPVFAATGATKTFLQIKKRME